MKKHNKILKCLFFVMMLSLFTSISFSTAQTDSNRVSLDAADDAVNHALIDLLDAEKAGVNITGLVNQLNSAAMLMAEAEEAYRNGQINIANSKSDAAVSIARFVSEAAQSAKETAQNSANTNFLLRLLLSILVIIVSIVVLFVVWGMIKHKFKNAVTSKQGA